MSLFVDLVAQVQRLLPIRFGGTGNDQGLGRGTVLLYSNITGATIALYSLVKLRTGNDDPRVTPTSAANDRGTIGIVVGRVITAGALAGEWEAVAPADGDGVAVMVSGRTRVLVAAAVTRGQYASSSATAGKAQGTSTVPPIGTFGIFEIAGSTESIVRLSGGSSTTAPEAVNQQGTSKVTDLTTLDFTDSLRVHASGGIAAVELEPSRAFLDALQVKVADAGALFTAPSPASGTETLRPTSDFDKSGSIGYSSGTTGWNLVDEVVLDTADYYQPGANAYIIHGFPATALDASKRITSITLRPNTSNPAPAADAFVQMRDPQTGVRYTVQTIGQNSGPSAGDVTLTTRPWDALGWTLDDLRHLQAGFLGPNNPNLTVRQFYIEVNWTAPKTVESVLQQVASGLGYLTVVGGGKGTVQAHGVLGATETIDLASGNYHWGTLDANCTFTFTGATNLKDCEFWLELIEDGTGGWSPTWPGSVVWPGGTPTHTTTPGTTTIYGFISRDGGTTWIGGQLGSGPPFATPAVVLGTAAAAGAATTTIRSDATIAAFDATVPGTSAVGDSAATGSVAKAARRDHAHGREAFGTPVSVGTANAAGSATTIPRSDHVHAGSTGANDHIHTVGEALTGDGVTTAFLLANEAIPETVAAHNVAGARVAVTLGGANDQITFGTQPGTGTFLVDYIPLQA